MEHTVIATKPARDEGFRIVLAETDSRNVTPFVTWLQNPEGHLVSGRYFNSHERAARDFKSRRS